MIINTNARISYQFFLHAIALLFWALCCLGHDNSQHAALIHIVHDARRPYPNSYESPTPTTKHSRHRCRHRKMNSHCSTSTLHSTSTSTITSPLPHHHTTFSSKVVLSRAAHKHKQPIRGSDHKRPNTKKHRSIKTITDMRKATSIATATPTLGLQQVALDQIPVNAYLNDHFNMPTSPAFDDLPYTNILSSSPPSSAFPPNSAAIATSGAPRASTLVESDTKDDLVTQLADGNGSSYTSFGSGLGLGIGCMVIAFGVAGFFVYYGRRHRQSPSDSMNQGIAFFSRTDKCSQQERTRQQQQSLMNAVTPRTCQPGGMSYTGIAIGSGHGAVELARQSSGVSIHSPPPLNRIHPYQY